MNILSLLPVRDWFYIIAAIIIAGAGMMFVKHERELGAQKAETQMQHERAVLAQQAADAASAAIAETTRREKALQDIINANQQTTAKIMADAAANSADRRNLGLQLDAFVRAGAAAGNSGTSLGGKAAGDALNVLANVFSRADARAAELARIADERGTAGAACERSYDALIKNETHQ
jgi:hypothetical protein